MRWILSFQEFNFQVIIIRHVKPMSFLIIYLGSPRMIDEEEVVDHDFSGNHGAMICGY